MMTPFFNLVLGNKYRSWELLDDAVILSHASKVKLTHNLIRNK
jgi:hypothetical protein